MIRRVDDPTLNVAPAPALPPTMRARDPHPILALIAALACAVPACVIAHSVPALDGPAPADALAERAIDADDVADSLAPVDAVDAPSSMDAMDDSDAGTDADVLDATEVGLDAVDAEDIVDAASDAAESGGDAIDVPNDARPDTMCPSGQTRCGGACTDLASDPANCGRCGVACPAGMSCAGGACTCPPGQTDCSGVCRDLQSDPDNCSSCGRACAAPHAAAFCVGATCAFACDTGFADCDGTTTNGCETATLADPAHCGGCAACASRPSATATCGAGACVYACAANRGDCDGRPETGCETDTRSDAANCGACGQPCTAGANQTATCAGGTCQFACTAGFGECDGNTANGCEADFATDPGNCGGCGHVCASMQTCTAVGCRG